MSAARSDILARLHGALGLHGATETRQRAVAARLADPPRAQAPSRVRGVDLVDVLRAQAEAVGATTARVASRAELGGAVADYLRARNLGTTVKLSPELAARDVAWPASFAISAGRATGGEI